MSTTNGSTTSSSDEGIGELPAMRPNARDIIRLVTDQEEELMEATGKLEESRKDLANMNESLVARTGELRDMTKRWEEVTTTLANTNETLANTNETLANTNETLANTNETLAARTGS